MIVTQSLGGEDIFFWHRVLSILIFTLTQGTWSTRPGPVGYHKILDDKE